jgi:hypothetical protein
MAVLCREWAEWLSLSRADSVRNLTGRLEAPKTIDLIVQEGNDKGKVAPGNYGSDKGQLRLCINTFDDPSYRPMDFKTQDRDGVGFAVLERFRDK